MRTLFSGKKSARSALFFPQKSVRIVIHAYAHFFPNLRTLLALTPIPSGVRCVGVFAYACARRMLPIGIYAYAHSVRRRSYRDLRLHTLGIGIYAYTHSVRRRSYRHLRLRTELRTLGQGAEAYLPTHELESGKLLPDSCQDSFPSCCE